MRSFEPLASAHSEEFLPAPLGAEAVAFRDVNEEAAREPVVEESEPEPDPDRLIAEARTEGFDAGRADGWAAGRAEGLEEGRAEGLAEGRSETVGSLFGVLERSAQELEELRARYLTEQREALIELALAIAEDLTRQAIRADRRILSSLLERAEAALGTEPLAELRLAPDDLEALSREAPEEVARFREIRGVTLVPDPSLGSGDSELRSGTSRVDLRLEALADRVREGLRESLAIPAPAPEPEAGAGEPAESEGAVAGERAEPGEAQ